MKTVLSAKAPSLSKKILISCFLAGCLEIYDFTIFGFLAATLHQNYLTFLDQETALIITYALFAVGFLFRPLGSVLFGYIGDRYGRKKALVLSVSMMGTASLAMCILPPYAAIGIVSCYIIALVRVIQGISVGGEYSGAIIYAVEHFDKKNAGFVGSIVVSGCMSGVLLAILVSNILKMPFIPPYGWRAAFLFGFILSLVGFFIRQKLTETPEFQQLAINKQKIPLLEGVKTHKTECLATILIAATNGVNLYFMAVYLPNYMKLVLTIEVGYLASLSTAIMAFLIPVFGILSDKFDRAKQAALGIGLLTLYAFIMLPTIYNTANLSIAIILIIIHAVFASIQAGAMNTFIVEIFPAKYRFSCSALSYSIGMGIIGGMTPMIASLITKNFGENPVYLSLYIASISFGGLIGVLAVIYKRKKLYKRL